MSTTETLQSNMKKAFYKRWVLTILGIIFILTPFIKIMIEGTMSFSELTPYLLLGVLGFIFIILAFVTMNKAKKLTAQIAEPVIKEVFGNDSIYDAFGHMPESLVKETGFIDYYERIHGSDFVKGHYRDVSIMFSDVTLAKTESVYNSEKKKYEDEVVIVFNGYWLSADFDRELTPVPLTVLEGQKGGSAIPMESEAFNRQFGVFCSDAHTAFYILTPHFMERLIEVDKAAKGKSYFYFSKNRLQIAVETSHDHFETSVFKAPDINAIQDEFRKDIGQLTSVLDEMLSHEHIFGILKENK